MTRRDVFSAEEKRLYIPPNGLPDPKVDTWKRRSSTDAGAGYPEIDYTTSQRGGLTLSKVGSSKGTMGLDIESNDIGYVATIQIGTV